MIIRFWENVYPAEVEAVLNAHPAVVRSAVIGLSVEGTEGGEEVVAFVQLVPSSPTSETELANGTTVSGGDLSCKPKGTNFHGCGIVFKLAPNSEGGWKETMLHRFVGHTGDLPRAGVIFDAAGNLYGTTSGDFGTIHGSVFEITQ